MLLDERADAEAIAFELRRRGLRAEAVRLPPKSV
jgi:hypothetical protein